MTAKSTIWLLSTMYLAGFIGLSISSTKNSFQFLTPFHISAVTFFLIFFQKNKSSSFWIFFTISALVGYLIEVLGVKTGLIFGEYKYLTTLGPKIFEVPPIIGLNWFLMIYCTGSFVLSLNTKSIFLKSLFGALLMTAFDFFAEPVAIAQNMWSWTNNNPPIQNYVAWFAISFVLLYYFNKTTFEKKNKLSTAVFWFQWLFFVSLFLFQKF
ncbi:carotenoid biosynthesis protein [Lacihabitans sp. LS3-19]|uniref:carotenoid biosynthesis protein n=1 Tax=Lacihabitans sp. LS3-19 TaxID=2487335 RepID=UPI0020CC48C2|nr:carotenoid biosynthesis protein [Lacihabitans sp. LS3-19]MCP9766952.1 carotenoid biosynthesis protein [Lacihabitans sp. LS3-19]